ncbi:MAG TPA: TlpA disulfide reductase family protein [Candidatus Acidoferrum sp.]|nr:TlpA disulfide reductase family protein [Candidatus Acidoferrum sp.]
MRFTLIVAVVALISFVSCPPTSARAAQTTPASQAAGSRAPNTVAAQGPTDPKAQKTFNEGIDLARRHNFFFAVGKFKKADQQDGGHCIPCQKDMRACAIEAGDWKNAEIASQELLAEAQGDEAVAKAHYEMGFVLLREAMDKKKREVFSRADEELTAALKLAPNFPQAQFGDGKALSYLNQDDAAKARFAGFVKVAQPNDPDVRRAKRFITEPDLARARMAPPFTVTTLDDRSVSLDDFYGKVVLLDFWATWCEPCREALPHMKEIANKFQGQPLVMLSISLDNNEQAWKDFVAKNGMTWLQYRDGGFTGPISRLFNVEAIPHTFTIDSDGILQQENVGDAAIDGKLKKLCARAEQEQATQTAAK